MTLYPCPRCGNVPEVSVQRTGSGEIWLAYCGCFGVYGHDEVGLAHSWTMYCVEMRRELDT